MSATIKIEYCGGWGYKRYSDALAVALQNEFGNDVTVNGVRDAGTTGRFEVTIVENGQLLHSKATKGQGKCESESEKAAVIAAVKSYLGK